VSSAARLSKELHTPQLSEVLYGLKQKVYLLKNGKTVDLAGTAGLGQNGYEAYKATPVAAKLLGAGLNDLTNSVKSNDKVRLIYCEGENSEGDSKIYQTLFPKYNDVRNLFISAGGISGVESAFHLGKELASTLLGPNAEVLCIVDRSGEIVPCPGEVAVTDGGRAFSDEVREKWMRCTDPDGNARMLGRREIENYLYDPAVLDEYDSEWRIKLDPPLPHNFDYKLHNVKDLISKKLPDVRPMELVRKLADKGTLDIGEIHDELKASIFDYPL
ncbi:hypothetical protein KC614_03205, partial [candidate division WWE3 bacterium]|nr:hypothetical protein [candidate division WWE3 bacterium]